MNKIHSLSAHVTIPELDLFTVPPTQSVVEKSLVSEHRPTSTLNSLSIIEFNIPTSLDEYILFSETYIHFVAKIKLKTGTSTVTENDWKACIPVANFMHSMIRMVEIQINGKEITRSPQTYAYRAYLENLMGFEESAKKSHLSSIGWDPDSFKEFIYPSDLKSENSKEFELFGKLNTDLTFQNKALLGGMNITIRLILQPTEFLFKLAPNHKVELTLVDSTLFVHRLKTASNLVTAHSRALSIAPAKYPISRVEVKETNIPKSLTDVMIDNIVLGQLPRRIFVVLLKNTAFNGSYTENSLYFDHFKLNYLACYIDGNQYPSKAYQPDFTNDKYIREYSGFLQAIDQNTTSTAAQISRKDYKSGKTIFGFNFSPDLTNGSDMQSHISEIKRGSLRIQLRFKEELADPINVLIFCEFDNLIEIDKDRQVYTDYN